MSDTTTIIIEHVSKQSVQRPTDVEDDLVVVGTRARLAGMDKLDALDVIIDCYDAEWST